MPTVEFQGTLHEFPDTFTDDQIGTALKRHAKGEALRGQHTQARGELLPRLAGMMPAPDGPQEPTRPQYQPSSFVDIAGENRVRPQFELPRPPRLSALDAARSLDMLAAGAEMQESAVAGQPQTLAGAEERLARDVTPGLGSKIVAGVQQTAAGLAEPEAVALMGATAGLGVLPIAAQRLASAGFAGWMAANAGEQAAELEQAIKDDDVEAAARATAGLGMDALFAGLSAKHSLQGIAKNNPRIAGWLSKKVAVADIPPAEVKAAYNRLERGMGTEADANLVRMVNEGFDRPGQAFREGVTVEETSPRVGPAFRDWLGVPEATGGRTVRLGATADPEAPAAAPARPEVRGLLSEVNRPSPATPPTTAAPAATAEAATPGLSLLASANEAFPGGTFVEWTQPDGRTFHGWVNGIGEAKASPGVSKGGYPVARVLVQENGGDAQVAVEQLRRASAPVPLEPIQFSPFDTAGSEPAARTRVREDNRSEWQDPLVPAAEPAATTAFDSAAVPTFELPIAKLKLSKDVPNFKAGASEETGTVAGSELTGKYQRTGTAPIVVWERLNGDTEVITGRHRFDLARRTGEQTIPAQVVREADGFTKDQALTFDAEANIRDGQGEVADYATYFKGIAITEAEARTRGLLSRAKGNAGWSLAKAATDDVYALWRADKLTDAQAVAIARAAPGDAGAQQIGSKFALQGKGPDFLTNVIKASKAEAGQRAESLDLFGKDDSAMKTMAEQAERASQFQKDIVEQIRAVQGAAKRPEAARKLGVDVKDPEGVVKRIAALKAELAQWENWPMQPELVAKVRGEPSPEAKRAASNALLEKEMLAEADAYKKRLEREAAEKAKAEEKAKADAAKGEQQFRIASDKGKIGIEHGAVPMMWMGEYKDTPANRTKLQKSVDDLNSGKTPVPEAMRQAIAQAKPAATTSPPSPASAGLGAGAASPRPSAGPETTAPAAGKPRKFTKAEAAEYSDLETKRREAQEGGERLSMAEAKRYSELTALAGQQELLAESGASSNAGRVATLQAKLAEVERLEGLARKRLYDSKSGSNGREMTLAEVRGYEAEAARLRAEIDTLKNGPKAAATAEPDLFGGSSFASASPMPARAAAVGSPPPLAGPPPLPHEEPSFSALPLGMPELVDLYKSLSAGQYPKVVQAIARLPWAAGVFRHQDATGVARVELLAKLFKLLTPEEEAALLAQAQEYAQMVAQPGDNLADLVRERYQMLLKQALEEAKRRGPVRAQQVLAHEIMHWIDWVPDHTLKRGNILGHIAAFKDSWLKHWLALDPAKPHGKPLSAYEKEKLRAEARKQMQAELGPMREIVRTILVEEPVWEIAGVKPEDVKNLFGINAREELPELYKWFAEQPAKVKLEIVKAAMKGLVDERLAAMGTKKQVGTKTTEKTVRERVGREPTPEEVAAKFQTLLREEIRKRNLVELETIKRELEATIAWYQGTPTMNPYFKTGTEMFAEAGSIWLNNPFALAQRAPTFHAALVNWLGHRPEVKKLYDQIQEDLRTGAHQDKRRQRLREMFKRGDEKGMERRRNALDKPQFLDGVRYELDRVFGPVYRRAKGTAMEGSIYKAVGDFRYRAAEQELFLARENNEVGRLLAENALDWSDFGELLTYRRIVEERFDLANPLGITPKDALEGIERLKATLGPVRYGKLVEAAERFNSLWQQMVVQPLVETGYVSPELADKMQGNTVYATFSVQRAQSEEGINRLLDMAFGAGIGPKIYRQMGTLQEIKNPATAAVLKGLSLISAVHRNTAKREVVKLMREVDPELIREADQNWNGKRHEWVMKDTPHVGTVVVMNAGQPVAYYVPRTIAEALNGADPMESQLAIAAIKANNTLKALYTQLNYGFWPVNLMRDTGSFWLQMPGAAAPLRWAKNLPRAYRAAVSSTKGTPNADAVDALKRLMVISRAEYRGLDAADEHELTLESFGQTPADWDRTAKQQHLLMRAWLKYKEFGQTFERLNKINGMLYLDEHFPDKPEWQKRKIVRELAGSPDFLERSGSAVVNWALMFYNPWKEGLHSLKAAAKADPWGFSFKTFAMVMLPAVLQALAASGLFGDERQKQYRSIPDYDLSNYWCIPLGWQNEAQGKVAYLRLPLAEPMRVLNGVVFHSLTDRGQGLAEYGAGQLPGLNSLAKVAMGWGTLLLAGKNPPDPLRGKDVIEPDVFEAGGLPVAQAMGKWTWNELGGGIIHRFRDPQLTDAPQENVEKFLQTPVVSNFLGRWVKVSSRGIDDQDRKLAEPVRQQRAQARVAVREMIRKFEAQEPWGPEERALVNRDAYAAQYLSETLAKVLAQRESLLLRRWEKRESSAERGAVFAPGK